MEVVRIMDIHLTMDMAQQVVQAVEHPGTQPAAAGLEEPEQADKVIMVEVQEAVLTTQAAAAEPAE